MIKAVLAIVAGLWAATAMAQDLGGLARVDMEASSISDLRGGVGIQLSLSQGVPYRMFTLDEPRRMILDFREIDWSSVDAGALDQAEAVEAVRVGGFGPGWSRMVLDLTEPLILSESDMALDAETGRAVLRVSLTKTSADEFAAVSGAPKGALWTTDKPKAEPTKNRFVIMLDPGHGGIDPGADQGGVQEKDLMLQFALELKELLVRSGDVEVLLTRTDDSFVSLDRRVAMAHQAEADLFLSLHADALSEGRAHGATVYTLSDEATDKASAALAERHNRADILAGVDLSGQDDVVADVLIDLAQQETAPRAERLAEALRLGIKQRQLELNTRPMRSAGFAVLRSPNIPSVLLELGFLSSEKDRINIQNPEWRGVMAASIRDAVFAWAKADEAISKLVRQ